MENTVFYGTLILLGVVICFDAFAAHKKRITLVLSGKANTKAPLTIWQHLACILIAFAGAAIGCFLSYASLVDKNGDLDLDVGVFYLIWTLLPVISIIPERLVTKLLKISRRRYNLCFWIAAETYAMIAAMLSGVMTIERDTTILEPLFDLLMVFNVLYCIVAIFLYHLMVLAVRAIIWGIVGFIMNKRAS